MLEFYTIASCVSNVAVKGAVQHGLKEGVQAGAAGGLTGFKLADFCHPLGELILQRKRGNNHFQVVQILKIDRNNRCCARLSRFQLALDKIRLKQGNHEARFNRTIEPNSHDVVVEKIRPAAFKQRGLANEFAGITRVEKEIAGTQRKLRDFGSSCVDTFDWYKCQVSIAKNCVHPNIREGQRVIRLFRTAN